MASSATGMSAMLSETKPAAWIVYSESTKKRSGSVPG